MVGLPRLEREKTIFNYDLDRRKFRLFGRILCPHDCYQGTEPNCLVDRWPTYFGFFLLSFWAALPCWPFFFSCSGVMFLSPSRKFHDSNSVVYYGEPRKISRLSWSAGPNVQQHFCFFFLLKKKARLTNGKWRFIDTCGVLEAWDGNHVCI